MIYAGDFYFNFPSHKDVETENTIAQAAKVVEEAAEVMNAVIEMGSEDVVVETLDVIHACESLLHMYDMCGVDINKCKNLVVAKNEYRGYYAD